MLYERLVDRIGPRPTLIERDDKLPAFDLLRRERARAHRALVGTCLRAQTTLAAAA
jgi:uncharacterized protein (UPF0276 family)